MGLLTQVTGARAKACQIRVDASTVTDPAKFEEYQDAQNALTGALGRLLVTVERYPDLKSNRISSRFNRSSMGLKPHFGRASRLHRWCRISRIDGGAIQEVNCHPAGTVRVRVT